MALQYDLPLSTTPLEDLASKVKIGYDELEKILRILKENGTLKRYGLNLNYRAFPRYRKAALVGLKAEVEKAKSVINKIDEVKVKHNFLRDSEFNVWFTMKGEDVEEIEKCVEEIVKECKALDYVILPTKKIYKMDVKYNLIKGISWSYKVEPEQVPTIDELGFEEEFLRSLESLPIAKRPFKQFKGYSEEEIVSIIEELLKIGVGRDFCGVLSERKIGFKENGMFVLRAENTEKVAKKLLSFPQITHLVERIPSEKWNYSLYFMVHAVERKLIEEIKFEVEKFVDDVKVIYSLRNLRE